MSDLLATGLLLKLDVTVWTGSAALSAPDLGLDPASIAAHTSTIVAASERAESVSVQPRTCIEPWITAQKTTSAARRRSLRLSG